MSKLFSFGIFALGGALGFFCAKTLSQLTAEKRLAKKLPLVQGEITIYDREGHFDIDGVSFDSSGVIIASDAHTPNP